MRGLLDGETSLWLAYDCGAATTRLRTKLELLPYLSLWCTCDNHCSCYFVSWASLPFVHDLWILVPIWNREHIVVSSFRGVSTYALTSVITSWKFKIDTHGASNASKTLITTQFKNTSSLWCVFRMFSFIPTFACAQQSSATCCYNAQQCPATICPATIFILLCILVFCCGCIKSV